MTCRPATFDWNTDKRFVYCRALRCGRSVWTGRMVLTLLLLVWLLLTGPSTYSGMLRAQTGETDAAKVKAASATVIPQVVDFPALGKEVVTLVEQKFYDAEQAQEWVKRHSDYAAAIQSREKFISETKRVLADLKTSHTDYYTPDEYAYFGIWSIFHPVYKLPALEVSSIGVELDSEHFIRWVMPGGPADKAGLRRGSQLVTAAGKPFHPIHSFSGHADQPVIVGVRRHRDGNIEEVTVTPHLVVPKQEWLAAQRDGATIVEIDGKRVAYVSLYSCAGMDPLNLLRELLGDKLQNAEALVLDFRFGWGGCPTEFVNLFNRQPPLLEMRPRAEQSFVMDAQWRKPVVLLINSGSRSGKEAVAYSLKKHQLALLVGETTGGAVVAGSCFRLSDESLVYLAVSDVRVDGERLEGVGVSPDISVADDYRFNDGADPQRDRALLEAVRLIKQSVR